MTRTFTGIFLPDAEREAVARFLARSAGDPAVRWVAPDLIHFTLRFFGDIDDAAIDRVKAITTQVAATFSPMTLRLSGTGVFPAGGRPRVHWLGLAEGSDEMCELARTLDRAYEGAGLGAADRPFRPHLTVGRVRGRPPARGAAGGNLAFTRLTFEGRRFRVARVRVVASRLSPRGPTYTPLADVLLPGGS